MGLLRTDKKTKNVKREMNDLIDRGHPLVTEDGRKLYGEEARAALPTLAGDSILDNILAILRSCK